MNDITRLKITDIQIPETAVEADRLLGKIADVQAKLNERQKKLKESIKKLQEADKKGAEDLIKKRGDYVQALHTYAHARKDELTQDAKTVKCKNGTFGWRLPTPTVITRLTDKALILWLKTHRKKRYVRVVEEVNREKLLTDRPHIPGVRYDPDDEFFAKPQFGDSTKTLTLAINK